MLIFQDYPKNRDGTSVHDKKFQPLSVSSVLSVLSVVKIFCRVQRDGITVLPEVVVPDALRR